MNRSNNATAGVIFAALLFYNATGTQPAEPPRSRPAIFTRYQGNAPVTQEHKDRLKLHCVAGQPQRREGVFHGPTRYIFRNGYVLESSLEFRMPLWVCEKLTADDVKDKGRLETSFKPDPELEGWPHARPKDFPKSGWAQGHLSPDANRSGEQLKRDTYFLSNVVPQAGQKFNSGIWLGLENSIRDWAAQRDLWIITGAFIHDPAEEDESSADGLVDYFAIGKSPVGVPTHLFKIVIAQKPDGTWETLSVVFPNTNYAKGTDPRRYLQSVQWIEDRTGFNFFPDPPTGFDAKAQRQFKAEKLWDDD